MSNSTARQIVVAISLISLAAAQAGRNNNAQSSTARADLNVSVVFEDERPVHGMIKVQLLNSAENSLNERVSSDSSGQVTFEGIPQGNYRLRVTGFEVVETVTNVFNISFGESVHFEIVRVRHKVDPKAANAAAAAPVSVTMLNIPDKAKEEYEKGMEALGKNDLEGAKKRFTSAIRIYPKYAEAMNSLGVIAMKQSDPVMGRSYFEKAVAADAMLSSAYVNLARLDLAAQHYAESEASLQKALTPDPLNLEALSLLAISQFSESKLEDAVATARKVHSLPHEKYAMVHYLAGAALDKLHKRDEAIEQFQTFLDEAPNSPSADKARNALRILRQQK